MRQWKLEYRLCVCFHAWATLFRGLTKNDHVRPSPLPHFCNVDAYTLRPRIRGITQIPPSNFALWGEGARQGWGHTLLVMVVFKSDPGPLKSNVICHATTRLEIEFPASTHGHGRFYIRPPYV